MKVPLFPNVNSKEAYTAFAKKHKFQPVPLAHWGKSKGRKRDMDRAESTDTREGKNLLEEGSEEGTSDEENLEQSRPDATSDSDGHAFAICEWLKTPVSHYTAKEILEHYSVKHLRSDIQVSIVDVMGKQRPISNWLTMQETIKSAFSRISSASEAKDAIVFLEKEIRRKQAHATNVDKGPPAILLHFGKLLDGVEVTRHFITHCEAALAAFSKFGTGLPEKSDETLKLLVKVTFVPHVLTCY
jgi:hypothetical protein